MVKTCSWGTCNSDTRYPKRIEGIIFLPFPKPKTNWQKCLRWIKACGRLHSQLHTSNIDRHKFICSKHFVHPNGPSKDFPDPIPADGSKMRKNRLHWRQRSSQTKREDMENVPPTPTCPTPAPQPCTFSKDGVLDNTPIRSSDNNLALELLSAAAELHQMKSQLQVIQEQLHQQQLLNKHLQTENAMLREQHSMGNNNLIPCTVGSILQEENKIPGIFEYFTGFKHSTFVTLFEYLTAKSNPVFAKKRKDVENMTSDVQLLLTLMRLRHNFGLKDLACRFCVSTQAVSEVFIGWIDHMYLLLSIIPIWPKREQIISKMPSKFKSEFPTSLAIIDCTELRTQKPSSLKLQSQMYSDYKSSTTLKGLVACDPIGNIIFVSELFTGSMSDKEITEKSGFYQLLQQLLNAGYVQPGDSIMADKGFTISEELAKLGLGLNIPPFVSAGCQLSQGDVNLTHKIAQHRIHVERAIRRIRTFKIVSNSLQTSVFGTVNKVWTVCCLLTLWQNPVLKDKDSLACK